jgi:hypothetical protein
MRWKSFRNTSSTYIQHEFVLRAMVPRVRQFHDIMFSNRLDFIVSAIIHCSADRGSALG